MSDRTFPIHAVDDLPATVAFYERLGFETTYRFPADDPAFVTLVLDGATVGISKADGSSERVAQWVYVDDVDATVADLRADGVEVVGEPVDQPWGERVAQVRAPDGTLVHLGAQR